MLLFWISLQFASSLQLRVNTGSFIQQIDVEAAFLNRKFDEKDTLYLNPPEDPDLGVKKGQDLKIPKAMYCFMRSPKIWHKTWNAVMHRIHFVQLKYEECLYFIEIEGRTVYVIVYVDNVLVVVAFERAAIAVKQMLMNEFQMTDLGVPKYFLDVELCISRKEYPFVKTSTYVWSWKRLA